mmetsp:Transcript_30318/g.55325  ORF Transcript_30318/g.55325 Transcript_30318/m.55325 type:complete len:237 (-) Transcript_30318:230-940(-)
MACRMRVIFTGRSPLPPVAAAAAGAGAGAGAGAAFGAGAAAAGAGAGAAAAGAAPIANLHITSPTFAVSSDCTKISVTAPLSGAVRSTVTLSVSISQRTVPFDTASPTCTFQPCTVPSTMLSEPKSGVLTSTTSPDPEAAAGAAAAGAGALAPAEGAPAGGLSEKVTRGLSTSAVSPSLMWISCTYPSCSAAASTVTLSVSMEHKISSFATLSPTLTFHSKTVPSVMLSAPKEGVF